MRRVLTAVAVVFLAFPAFCEKPIDWKEPKSIACILSIAESDASLPRGLSHCVAYTESRFHPAARSRVVDGYRSCGLMQLNRRYLYGYGGLADRFGSMRGFQWDDPEHSAEVGCQYLAWLIKRYNGSIWLALVAYNWGPENVRQLHSLDEIPQDVVQYANGILALCDEWKPEWAEGGK